MPFLLRPSTRAYRGLLDFALRALHVASDENGNRYISDEMIEEDRKAGMPEFLIQQEYYSVITVQHERLYFSREMQSLEENKRIISNLILPKTVVYAFYDLGVNDSTAVILVQFDHRHNPNIIY